LVSASRNLGEGVLGYASLARGAKSGGINPNAPVPGLSINSLYFKPEVTVDAELGVKSMLANERLVLNLNLFWMRIEDYQATLLLQPNAGNTFQQTLSNIGDVRTQGVEADLAASLGGVNLRLAASFNDATYLSYHDAPCAAEELAPNLAPGEKECDLSGSPLVGAPRWIVNPSIDYRHPAFGNLDWSADVAFAWRSTFFGSADDSRFAQVPSYGILNLRWTLEDGHDSRWAISFWSNNVCDKRYVIGGLSVSGPLYNYIATPGPPRTVGATARFKF
jgi:iron complex outermembrane receptor protein